MTDIHRRIFKLYMLELDGRLPDPAQHAELQAHLSTCPSCRADRGLHQALRLQAEGRWPETPLPPVLEKRLRAVPRRPRLLWLSAPLRAVMWAALALLLLFLVQWVFSNLRPVPAVLPTVIPTDVLPTGESGLPGKTPVEPILHGDPYARGMWSPEQDYFFVPILEAPPPGGDRRITSLHFIATSNGEDCPASETFLGNQGTDQNYAWLDNERVLFIDKLGHASLFTRCQPGFQDLSDRFDEPLLRVARVLTSPEVGVYGPLLLEAPSAYWLLDPVTLQARPLADPVPASDIDPAALAERASKDPIPYLMLPDSFAWLPAGHQISVIQPIEGDTEHSRLVLLDLDSGQVLRSLEVEAYSEGMAPSIEWMGPERPFIWGFGTGGPLLVDLSLDPPAQLHAFPDLFGFDLVYPDEVFSMGAFYSGEDDRYHIVVHANKQGDTSIYVYHSETGQVEKLDGERQVMMILPGDQRMPLAPLQDTPTYGDGYDLVWVDAPDRPGTRLEASGHSPRNYYMLASRLLPGSTRMLFGSSQGVSLLDLLSGETLVFWTLTGAEDASSTSLAVSPNGKTLIAMAHPGGTLKEEDQAARLYWIPLDEPGSNSSP